MRFPTYSEATATFALFIALGGTSYAVTSLPARSVGSSQLKSGSVTAAKLHAQAVGAAAVALDSLTGKQIDEASLAEVPRAKVATSASTAATATTAISAASATTAKAADSATTAGTATTAITASTAVTAATATNATMLGGAPPASYQDSCPSGMHQTRDLCFDFTTRTAAIFTTALATCGAAGLRLPSVAESVEAFNDLEASQVQQWTDEFFFNSGFSVADIGDDANRAPQFGTAAISNTFPYRCVTTASD